MSFDAYLNSHMTGFPSAEEYRKASQIKNQKHNLQCYSSSYQDQVSVMDSISKEIIERIMFCKEFL